MVHGVLSFSLSAVLERVNITIWKGTTMENTHRKYSALQKTEFTRAMYQAAMEVPIRIRAVERMVMTTLYFTLFQKG